VLCRWSHAETDRARDRAGAAGNEVAFMSGAVRGRQPLIAVHSWVQVA
jgi:hypothetical protein